MTNWLIIFYLLVFICR